MRDISDERRQSRRAGAAATLWAARVCARQLRCSASPMNPHRFPPRASLAGADPCRATHGTFTTGCEGRRRADRTLMQDEIVGVLAESGS